MFIGPGCELLHLFEFGVIVSIPDEMDEGFHEIIPTACEGVIPKEPGGSLHLCCEQRLMFCRETQHPVQDVSKLVEGEIGGRHIDAPHHSPPPPLLQEKAVARYARRLPGSA